MSRFNKQSLAILPLLSILYISPSEMQIKIHERGPASSVIEEVKAEKPKIAFPRYEALVSKVDKDSLLKDESVSLEKVQTKDKELKEKIALVKSEFKKELSEKEEVLAQRKGLEDLVIEVLLVEDQLKDLKEKELIKAEEEELSLKSVVEHKSIIEELLGELDKNENLVASSEVSEETPIELEAEAPVAPKDEVTAEEGPEAEEPVVIAEEEPEAPKEEVKKDEEVCASDARYELLTQQMEQLMNDQKQILMSMLNMSQTMMQIMQRQMQPNPMFGNNLASVYQYQPQQTAGNWVYYPSGFQPGQPNIFAQGSQAQGPQAQGFYPDQSHQQAQAQAPAQQPQMQMNPQNNWNLMPQPQFQMDPRFTPMAQEPGIFGNEAFSFNMGPSQAPAPSPLMAQIQ